MSIDRLWYIASTAKKSLRNATISLALVSVLQSCDNATWTSTHSDKNTKINGSYYDDNDIDEYEARLPYAQQRNEPISAISQQDSLSIETMLSIHTLRSKMLDEKPTMDTIKYIALHSTEAPELQTVLYLQKSWKIHYLIKRDGTLIQYLPDSSNRLVQINHIGKETDSMYAASWDHDHYVTFKTIGIEISAMPWQKRTDAQYTIVKKFLGYLWQKYNLKQKDVFTHTMVAYTTPYWFWRKHDPVYIDRNKLWLPPASDQINRDVVAWEIAPNLLSMYQWLRKRNIWKNPWLAMTHTQAIIYLREHYMWLDNSIMLYKQRSWDMISSYAHRGEDHSAWMSIDEIDKTMKHYMPPVPIYKKKQAYKARHKK